MLVAKELDAYERLCVRSSLGFARNHKLKNEIMKKCTNSQSVLDVEATGGKRLAVVMANLMTFCLGFQAFSKGWQNQAWQKQCSRVSRSCLQQLCPQRPHHSTALLKVLCHVRMLSLQCLVQSLVLLRCTKV